MCNLKGRQGLQAQHGMEVSWQHQGAWVLLAMVPLTCGVPGHTSHHGLLTSPGSHEASGTNKASRSLEKRSYRRGQSIAVSQTRALAPPAHASAGIDQLSVIDFSGVMLIHTN